MPVKGLELLIIVGMFFLDLRPHLIRMPLIILRGTLASSVYVNGRQFETVNDFWDHTVQTWESTSNEMLRSLLEPMQKNCIDVLEQNRPVRSVEVDLFRFVPPLQWNMQR